jgi:hypothetical protein
MLPSGEGYCLYQTYLSKSCDWTRSTIMEQKAVKMSIIAPVQNGRDEDVREYA